MRSIATHLARLSCASILTIALSGGYEGTRRAAINAKFVSHVSALPHTVAYGLIVTTYALQLLLTVVLLHPLMNERRRVRLAVFGGLAMTCALELALARLSDDHDGTWKSVFMMAACAQHALNAASSRHLRMHGIWAADSRLQQLADRYTAAVRVPMRRYRMSSLSIFVLAGLMLRAVPYAWQLCSGNVLARELAASKLYHTAAIVAFVSAVGSEDRHQGRYGVDADESEWGRKRRL